MNVNAFLAATVILAATLGLAGALSPAALDWAAAVLRARAAAIRAGRAAYRETFDRETANAGE